MSISINHTIKHVIMTTREVLQKCTVSGNVVTLPAVQLERKDYQDVAKQLNLIGGKWKGGKVQGFVFEQNPTDLLGKIANGGNMNLKKEFQFFPTPSDLARKMVEAANPTERNIILEPSAGRGAIVEAINDYVDVEEIFCYELMELNVSFLSKIENVTLVGEDFLKCQHVDMYDIIIANPPFSKNQDIDHILKMYSALKPGGRMVALCSPHYKHSSGKKEAHFKQWLDEVGAMTEDIAPGTFKESGTSIATVMIVINKPHN